MVCYPMTIAICSGATCARPNAVTAGAVAPLFDTVVAIPPEAASLRRPVASVRVRCRLPSLAASAFSARRGVGNVQRPSMQGHGSGSRGRDNRELWRAFGNADSVKDALRRTVAARDPSRGGRFMPAEHTAMEGVARPMRDDSPS